MICSASGLVGVVYGADASQPDELVLRGTVATIAEQVEAAGLRQAAVILVGRALADGDAAGGTAGESHLYDPARTRGT